MTNENKRKVMIVDDYFVDKARDIQGVKPFDFEDYRAEMEAPNREALIDYLIETKNPPFFDLTTTYKDAGGRTDTNLLVLGDPIYGIPSNMKSFLDQEWLAKKIFDESRALTTIRDENPDVLILDIGFYAPLSNSLIEEYIIKRRGKKEQSFNLRPEYRTSEIDFPLSGNYLTGLLGNSSWSLQSNGGVILAHALQKEGRRFSFWTSELAHGGEGISHAYTLDLLSKEDISQVVASDNASYLKHCEVDRREKQKLPKGQDLDSEDYDTIDIETPVAQDDNGKIVVANKSYYFNHLDHKDKKFKPNLIPKLEKIIGIAEKYQQQS